MYKKSRRKHMKKKACCPILILVFICLVSVPVFSQETGDVNNDSVIGIIDALLVAQFYIGMNPANFVEDVADTNCDGTINIVDALLIARYSVGLISEFGGCTQTPVPEITPEPGIPTDPGDCIIPCTANTVPPSLTTDPGADPTPAPVLTPAPTRAPRVGDVTIGGAIINEINVCSTFSATVYANTGDQLLSSYNITVSYSTGTLTPDICSGINGINAGTDGFVTTVDAQTSGKIIVSGFDAGGIGPGTKLKLFNIKLKAIDFGETSRYYGNSYFATGSFSITVNELLDPSGAEIGDPYGVTYRSIGFYSGDYITGIPSFPQ
jgi:hypothetical protein